MFHGTHSRQQPPFPPRNLNNIFMVGCGIGIPIWLIPFKSLKLIQARARSPRKNECKARSQQATCRSHDFISISILLSTIVLKHTFANREFQGNFTPTDAEFRVPFLLVLNGVAALGEAAHEIRVKSLLKSKRAKTVAKAFAAPQK